VNKINVVRIILSHLETLRDHSTGRRSWPDIIFFFGVPLIVCGVALYFKWSLYVDALNALLAAFSIFAGLLLNLLILIYTFASDRNHPTGLARVRKEVVRQLHDNIAFSVLIAMTIAVVALVGVAQLKVRDPSNPVHTGPLFTFFLIYLTGNFVLTMLMILKRIYILLNQELEQPSIRKAS
jgi:hypothetical protein